ncbi:MAG: AAA family ATPase [Bacillota bacterium]|nr:AAA family ATPase [Bacillota bacterium]
MLEPQRQPVMTIMIGLPRAGKTTYANKNKGQAVILCADELRYLVYNQRFWGEGEPLMWSIHDIILKMLLQQGADVVIDETNYTWESREPLISLAKEYGYWVQGVVLSTPREVCIGRAQAEGYSRIIPFIRKLSEMFDMPSLAEGLDHVLFVERKD